MAQTINDIPLDDTWKNINAISGISVGESICLTNKSPNLALIAEGTKPDSESYSGLPLSDLSKSYAQAVIPTGSLTIWMRSNSKGNKSLVSVQRVS